MTCDMSSCVKLLKIYAAVSHCIYENYITVFFSYLTNMKMFKAYTLPLQTVLLFLN